MFSNKFRFEQYTMFLVFNIVYDFIAYSFNNNYYNISLDARSRNLLIYLIFKHFQELKFIFVQTRKIFNVCVFV